MISLKNTQKILKRCIFKMASSGMPQLFSLWIWTMIVFSAVSEFEETDKTENESEERLDRGPLFTSFIYDGETYETAQLTMDSTEKILAKIKTTPGFAPKNYEWCFIRYGKYSSKNADENEHSCVTEDIKNGVQLKEETGKDEGYTLDRAMDLATSWLENKQRDGAQTNMVLFADRLSGESIDSKDGLPQQFKPSKAKLEEMGADVFVAMLSRDAKVEELSQLVSSEEDLQFYDDYDEIAHKITHRKQNKPKVPEPPEKPIRKRPLRKKETSRKPLPPWKPQPLPKQRPTQSCVCPPKQCECPPRKPQPCLCSPQQEQPCCCSPTQQPMCVCSPQQQQPCVCPQIMTCPPMQSCVCPTTASPETLETCSEFPYKKIGCYEQPNYDARNAAFYTIMTPSSMRSWGDYLSGLVCQCSAAAKYKGHLFFGVKYHNPDDPAGYKGECFTSRSLTTFTQHRKSDDCINTSRMECDADQSDCTGKKASVYVYSRNLQGQLKLETFPASKEEEKENSIYQEYKLE